MAIRKFNNVSNTLYRLMLIITLKRKQVNCEIVVIKGGLSVSFYITSLEEKTRNMSLSKITI